MAKIQSYTISLVLATLLSLLAASQAHLKIHIVGGSYGWKIPPTTTFYQDWAKNQTFVAGDKLMFLYTSGMQNVVVGSTEDDFATCQQKNVVDILYEGPSTVELTEAGTHYFYCSVGLHCERGQKLKINVNASA
ncbi:cucumber peeling cupredoxin-like [Curcuma longa]|uniref:cucumber peeling cupredoxin-like n=1 Tax=Curcuma longa TaxID=136217 RepID=UPI003D9E2111